MDVESLSPIYPRTNFSQGESQNEKANLFLCAHFEFSNWIVSACAAEELCHHFRICGFKQHVPERRRFYREVANNGPDLSDLLGHNDH